MLKINTTQRDSATILDIFGEVDLYSSPEVRSALLQLVEAETAVIVVNLNNVTYIDSSGIATLVEGLQEMEKYSGKLKLTNLRDAVRNVFELSSLDKVFEIHDTLEEALNGV